MTEYAIYKGENLLAIGTRKELAAKLKVKEETILFYGTLSHIKRSEKRSGSGNFKVLVKLEE